MGSLVAEFGAALEDALALLSTSAPPLEGCDVCCLEKEKECAGLVVDQDDTLIVTPHEKLEEHVMLPRSRNILLCKYSIGWTKFFRTWLSNQHQNDVSSCFFEARLCYER